MPVQPNPTDTGHLIGRGRRERDTEQGAPPQAPTPTTETPAPAPPINITNNKYKILNCKYKALLFPEMEKRKNRRFTPDEFELEKLVAKAFKRPYRTFFNDPPTYPYVVPEPLVNFKLNFTE